METWKIIDWIEGIPPIYAVSDYGNVKNVSSHKEYVKKQQIDKYGYKRVTLYGKKPFKKFVPVHRLVAIAFISNPCEYLQVNHKDENKQNNMVENLEWCTCDYNNNYGNRNERISTNKKGKARPYMVRDEKGRFIGSLNERRSKQ